MYNPDFKVVEFGHFKNEAGLHTFTLRAIEWMGRTNAIGLYVQAGPWFREKNILSLDISSKMWYG